MGGYWPVFKIRCTSKAYGAAPQGCTIRGRCSCTRTQRGPALAFEFTHKGEEAFWNSPGKIWRITEHRYVLCEAGPTGKSTSALRQFFPQRGLPWPGPETTDAKGQQNPCSEIKRTAKIFRSSPISSNGRFCDP